MNHRDLQIRLRTISIFLLLSGLSFLCAANGTQKQVATKRIAITIDDLPGWRPVTTSDANRTMTALAKILKDRSIPATGFVVGNLASRNADSQAAIESWAKAGFPLANHTWEHVPYAKVDPATFWSEVDRTEEYLKPLRQKYGPWPLMFRFPMLNQGKDKAHLDAANAYLLKKKTFLAQVSVDTSDWAFAQEYDASLALKDPKRQKKIKELYLEHIFDCVKYAESASEILYQRPIAQIILLHANLLNVAKLGEILDGLKNQGYEFITLEEALKDSAYQPFHHQIASQTSDHFFVQSSALTKKPLPQPDRSAYKYYQSYWEPILIKLR